MRLSLPYGERPIEGDTPLSLRLLEPIWPRALSPKEIRGRFPAEALKAFLQGRRKLAVLIPDQTRRCDAQSLLALLSPLLRGKEVHLLTANGLHPPMPEATLCGLYGEEALRRWPLAQHDADDASSLADIGISPRGNRVRLNRLAVEADAILALSSISFHYFAGFGGGRKLLMPGVAARDTIAENHKMVVSLGTPGPGVLRGNPLHSEMRWVEREFCGRIFHIITGLDKDYSIAALWGGEGGGPLLRASSWLREKQAVPLERRYPFAILSCGGAPKDINVIQAHKSLEFAHRAVEPGGVLLFAASCCQGIGSSQFLPWFRFAKARNAAKCWADALMQDYQVNGQTALKWYIKSRSHEIWMLTDLPEEEFRPLGARRFQTLQESLDLLTKRFGSTEGLLIPHAASVLPLVRNP